MVFLGITTFSLFFLIDFLRNDRYTLTFVVDHLPVSATEIHHNHVRLTFISEFGGAAAVAAAVCWLVWQYRAQANLRVLASGSKVLHPLWVLPAWLVSPVNLVAPPLLIRHLWRNSDPESPELGRWGELLLWTWWAVVLVADVVGALALTAALKAHPTPQDLLARDDRGIIWAGFAAAAAVLGLFVVHAVNDRQEFRERRLHTTGWSDWRGGRPAQP